MSYKKVMVGVAGLAVAGGAFAASASAYTWSDQAAGVGHVGKGEVQSVFNWNNKKVQDAYVSPGIWFSMTEFETWSQACTGHRGDTTLYANRERTRADKSYGVDSANNQVTSGSLGDLSGWALTGWGDTVKQTSGWGTNPWAALTNNGCPPGSKPNGGPTRTTWMGPLDVNSGNRSAHLTAG